MSMFLRQVPRVARNVSNVRAFSSTPLARKDIVQEMYLREIKSYTPAPAAKDAHVGVVKPYSLPPAPKPPTVPVDLASELQTYEATEVTLSSEPSTTKAAVAETTGASGAAEFLTFLEQDLPKKEHHH